MKNAFIARRGFTLIELLAAMTVLALLALFVAQVFTSSTKAWSSGTRSSLVNVNGRTALTLLAEDLATAVADSNLTFSVDPGVYAAGTWTAGAMYGGAGAAKVNFFAANAEPLGTERGLRAIKYFVKSDGGTNSLMRWTQSTAATMGALYGNTTWDTGVGNVVASPALLDNVTAFEVRCNGLPTPFQSTAPANSNSLPAYVDLVVAFLGDEDAETARQMSNNVTALQQFITLNERRFVTRVYFANRNGYLAR